MPVFDFSNMQAKKEPVRCTYAMVYSDNDHASPENPILVIDNQKREWKHHSFGIFANPNKQTTFEFEEEDGTISADILKVDARFVSLLKWLGEHHIHIQLSGKNVEEGYAVYKIQEISFGGRTKLSAEDGFLQFMIERLFASPAPAEEVTEEVEETTGAGVIAPIVATAAAAFTFWWLGKYSTICERDIVGTTITVWCAVVIRIMLWAEKEEAE